MIDEKEYEEVFFKDSRNLRGGLKDGKKRNNVKDLAKRQHQIEKRLAQKSNAQMQQQGKSSSNSPEVKEKKYKNGKPQRVVKEVPVYVEQSPEKKQPKKKQIKNRKI